MDAIILIPGLLALCWCLAFSPWRAFLDVYVPVLLLAPVAYQFRLQGLPDLTLDKSAILPVLLWWLAGRRQGWRWSSMDALVAAYVAGTMTAEYWNNGGDMVRTLLVHSTCTVVAPYVLAKNYLAGAQAGREFAKRFVWLLAIVSVVSVVEFRLGLNLFRAGYGAFFPGQTDPNVFVQYRWGFGRVAGPFEHAIFAGLILGIGLILHGWLAGSGLWERSFRWFGLRKAHVITAALLLGLAMTLSRGPWVAAMCGLTVTLAGMSSRKRAVLVLCCLVLLAAAGWWMYASAFRSAPGKPVWDLAEDSLSIAYRADLVGRYEEIVKARPWLGYGTITWPRVQGMRSIDNAFLQLTLSYGLMGSVPFLLMIVLAAARLVRSLGAGGEAAGVRWALLGVLVAYSLNLTSVYLGNQAAPLFFLFIGWIEGETIQATRRAAPVFQPAAERRWVAVT